MAEKEGKIYLGDYFLHERSGARFACRAIIMREVVDPVLSVNVRVEIEGVPQILNVPDNLRGEIQL